MSGDTSAKLGGILAIVALMNADVCNTGTRISRCVIFSLGSNPVLWIQFNLDLGIQSKSWDPIQVWGSNSDLGIQSRSLNYNKHNVKIVFTSIFNLHFRDLSFSIH